MMATDPHPDSALYQLAYSAGDALKSRGWYCATAESCTGGGIASAITSVAGSSAWFACGWVTYSNISKEQLLGVSAEVLDKQGAVSEAVVRQMAEGAQKKSGVDITVAVSGVAGPDGGTPQKPVGMVCIAWSTRTQTESATFMFDGSRAEVRLKTIEAALNGLIRLCCVS